MVYKGVARGKMIELEQRLPYPEGQPVSVSVEPVRGQAALGSPEPIRRAMHEPPHLESSDVDELERGLESGRLPFGQEGRRRT